MSRFARHAIDGGASSGLVTIVRRWATRTFHTTAAIHCDPVRNRGSGGTDERDRTVGSSTETAAERQRRDLDASTIRGKILSNTVLSRNHLTPEIALHLITPECDIYHRPVGAGDIDTGTELFPMDPFWGFFWPGGQALTRFVLDTEYLFRGKSVLDVGCGCGASAIAAKLVGARSVVANDIDHVALQATLLNAKVNEIPDDDKELEVCNDNLIGNGAATARYDVVLIGDLFYDTEIATTLHPWIHHLARAGKEIYIGDPGRHGITEFGVLRSMILKAHYELPENVCLENNGFSHASVWQYAGSKLGKP